MSMCSRNKKDAGEQIIRGGGAAAAAAPAMMRKGPWTEEEDAQLVRFVRLFGERRWDFLAKVSGLRRTGKSCRLRWVNYLHPDLRRGGITADEERLIVELYTKWGSRWSRIARSLPGRTDNEIKNFWRTRTRKKALEDRRLHGGGDNGKAAAAAGSPLSSSVTTASCGSPNSGAATPSSSASDDSALREGSGGGDAELELEEESTAAAAASQHEQQQEYCCRMDQLWNEIAAADAAASYVLDGWGTGHCYYGAVAGETPPVMPPSSPVWEYSSDYSLWRIDDEEYYREMLDAS